MFVHGFQSKNSTNDTCTKNIRKINNQIFIIPKNGNFYDYLDSFSPLARRTNAGFGISRQSRRWWEASGNFFQHLIQQHFGRGDNAERRVFVKGKCR
jgi:hypothetical protein